MSNTVEPESDGATSAANTSETLRPQICNGVIVITDDVDDVDEAGLEAALAVGAEMAERAGVAVLLYDRSGETWVDTPHPEGPLDPSDDRLADRSHLRDQMGRISDAGASAQAWLPTVPTISGVETALQHTGADVVVVSSCLDRRFLERALPGDSIATSLGELIERHPMLDATVIEVGDDGTTQTVRSGRPSSPRSAVAPIGDVTTT